MTGFVDRTDAAFAQEPAHQIVAEEQAEVRTIEPAALGVDGNAMIAHFDAPRRLRTRLTFFARRAAIRAFNAEDRPDHTLHYTSGSVCVLTPVLGRVISDY